MRRDLADSGDPLRKTDLLAAQSVIYHAIDRANWLGLLCLRRKLFVAGSAERGR